MRRMPITLALAALIAASALQAQVLAPAFAVGGHLLGDIEASTILGGETYMSVDRTRTRAVVTSIPRDSYGMDYSRASSYSVEVHNRVTAKEQKGVADMYDAARFPAGEAAMTVGKISDDYRSQRYGSSQGEWIKTNASQTVTAYPRKADGTADRSQPYQRADYGYYIHANNAIAFDRSESAGCIVMKKSCLDRVISTLRGDSGRRRINVD